MNLKNGMNKISNKKLLPLIVIFIILMILFVLLFIYSIYLKDYGLIFANLLNIVLYILFSMNGMLKIKLIRTYPPKNCEDYVKDNFRCKKCNTQIGNYNCINRCRHFWFKIGPFIICNTF